MFTQSGGIEVARTPGADGGAQAPDRLVEVVGDRGRADHAGPGQGARPVHRRGRSSSAGSTRRASASSTRSGRARSCARRRMELGALTISAQTEVTGIDVERRPGPAGPDRPGRHRDGDVVIACGVWSPRIARMAGASIPLTPAVHQMISVGPVPLFADTVGEIAFPIVRDMDTNMYERQHGGDLEVGSYAHRAILMDARRHPVDRGVGAVADRAAVHPGGLRPADGARPRADPRDPRRRAGRASATRSTACSR